MKIIEDLAAARQALARPVLAGLNAASPEIRERLRGVFGEEIGPEEAVRRIIRDVKSGGDAAVRDYTARIDRVELAALEVEKERIFAARGEVMPELVAALELAAERIREFHSIQKSEIQSRKDRGETGWLMRPLQRVGVYAPGGTASYPSTVLMAAIPAKVAGVEEVVVVTPPGTDGAVPPATLVAADIAGVERVFRIGGAQAIAALACGTESVPRVDKICGPGNIFVVLAKKMVYGEVDIDGLHGPSEVVIIADETADAGQCVAELLAQAEHDPLAEAILITTSRRLADDVNGGVGQQAEELPRCRAIVQSLENGGKIIVVDGVERAIELANLYAPEHLHLIIEGAESYIDRIAHAGTVFIGERSTVVLGDYVAGPSHVLPTGGTARFTSPLNVGSFLKMINLVNVDEEKLSELAQTAVVIARAEGLEAHARAVAKWVK